MIKIDVVANTPNDLVIAWANKHIRSASYIVTDIISMSYSSKHVPTTKEMAQCFNDMGTEVPDTVEISTAESVLEKHVVFADEADAQRFRSVWWFISR